MLRENLGRIAGAVSAHQFPLRLVPQQHLPVIAVESVEIAALARTFTRQAKRHFTQPSQLLQGSRRLVRLRQIDRQIAVFRQAAVAGQGCLIPPPAISAGSAAAIGFCTFSAILECTVTGQDFSGRLRRASK